ncbi:unnamed protein product, partial [Iphiclides podalirius]
MFLNEGSRWYVGLVGHLIHPEYEEGFTNTVAILFLESGNNPRFWQPITLTADHKKLSRWSKVYNVGYTDRNTVLEQELLEMEYVSRATCEEFYVKEEINFDFLWPPNALCFKMINSNQTCVNNAGMALASNVTDAWILMGLSTQGPGCSLPARYIEIFPYVKWIRDHTIVKKSTRRQSYYHEAILTQHGYKSYDELFFQHLTEDYYLRLYPSYANITENVEGCYWYGTNKSLMYKDEEVFNTKSPSAIGVYGLYLIDTNFMYRTCVQVYTRGTARSKIYLYTLYAQPHPADTPMFGKTVASRVKDAGNNESYMVITDPRPIHGLDTTYLYFRFQFSFTGLVVVTIFGEYNGTEIAT